MSPTANDVHRDTSMQIAGRTKNMPYKDDGSDVPDGVPNDKRKQFAAVFNKVMADMHDEGKAMASAYAAIKKSVEDDLTLIDQELEKAGARHSRSDMAMFDKVMEMMDSVKAMMAELKGQNKMEDETMEKKDVRPEVGGGTDVDKLPAENFVDPKGRRFPIKIAQDVRDAVRSFGRMGEPKIPLDEFRRRLTAIATRLGFEDALPKSWGDEVKKSMGLMDFMQKVRDAFEPNSPSDGSVIAESDSCYVMDVLPEGALLHMPDGFFIADFSFDGDKVTPSDKSMWKEAEREWHVKEEPYEGIYKSDESRHLIYAIAMKPEPYVDTQGDIASADEIEKGAHGWMENYRVYDEQHKTDVADGAVVPVESYIAPVDIMYKGKFIPQGSWVVVSHVKDDTIWNKIQKGEINAYSIRGYCEKREKVGN